MSVLVLQITKIWFGVPILKIVASFSCLWVPEILWQQGGVFFGSECVSRSRGGFRVEAGLSLFGALGGSVGPRHRS